VRLVSYPVVDRRAGHGVKLYSSPHEQMQAPVHSGVDLTQAQQAELFGQL
jgi:hypothetical protein